jgi:fumarate hydratase class II
MLGDACDKPVIGYDKASAITHKADDAGLTLKAAALASGYIDERQFDQIRPQRKDWMAPWLRRA